MDNKNEVIFSETSDDSYIDELYNKEVKGTEQEKLSEEDFDEIVARFKREKEILMKVWKQVGFRDGQVWAQWSPYFGTREYVESLDERIKAGTPWPDTGDRPYLHMVEHYFDNEHWAYSTEESYWLGFADGVVFLWNKINEHIEKNK